MAKKKITLETLDARFTKLETLIERGIGAIANLITPISPLKNELLRYIRARACYGYLRPEMHGVADTERLKLSAEPDGFGFFYGWAERNGERVRVDVLPPEHLWRGDIKLEGQKPDAQAWVLYLDGEEFARVERGPAGGAGY